MHAFCWTKIKILIKTKRNWKWKIPHIVLERQTLCLSLYKSRTLKLKLQWVGARERKRGHFLSRLFYLKEAFFKIWVISQCIVHWIHFQNIHAFTYKKTLLHAILLLVFKIFENLKSNHLAYIGAQNRKFTPIYIVTRESST